MVKVNIHKHWAMQFPFLKGSFGAGHGNIFIRNNWYQAPIGHMELSVHSLSRNNILF